MELEFIALDKANEKAEWLRHLLEGIPLWPKPINAIYKYYDNLTTSMRVKNSVHNGKSRHIRHRHNIVRELLTNGIIFVNYVKLKENLLDHLTKGMTHEQVRFISKGMGLKPLK